MRKNISAALLATALLPIGLLSASAEPDVAVTDGDISTAFPGGTVVFREDYNFNWTHRTENVGTTTLPGTQTDVRIDSKRPTLGGVLGVPGMAPGAFRADDGQFSADFTNWKYGSYSTKICADARHAVTEKDETNNCLFRTPIHVVPARLKGTITGAVKLPPPAVLHEGTWSADVELRLSRTIRGNVAVIHYEFKKLKVTYTVKGTTRTGNCKYHGTATDEPPDPQKMTLRFGLLSGQYSARNKFNSGFTIPVTIECPKAPPIPATYIATHDWFWTRGSKPFDNPGLDVLEGTADYDAPGGVKVSWAWSLQALDAPEK